MRENSEREQVIKREQEREKGREGGREREREERERDCVLTWADSAATGQERLESDAVTNNLSAVVTGGAASAPPAGAICRCGQRGAVQQRLKSSSRKSRLGRRSRRG
jgi:hypothetical protein